MKRTLLSLAIIRTNWEQLQKDYIENYVPLVASLIFKKKYNEISFERLETICKDFEIEFGLVLPSNPMLTILNRLSKRKYIIRKHGRFLPDFEKLSNIDISKNSSKLLREFEKFIKALAEFINEKHALKIDIIELEAGLINFLKKHDLELLFAAEDISILPQVKISKKIDYLISDFISVVYRSEPEFFKYILNLSIGHAISSTILYKEFNSYSGKLKGLNIYFDTPFIMNLLGFSGEFKKKLAIELLSFARKEQANLYILEITKGEIDANLREALKAFEKGKTNPRRGSLTFRNCLAHNITYSDVENIYVGLPDILEKYEITLDEVPNYDDYRKYQVDEPKLYDTITKTYNSIKHSYASDENCNMAFVKQFESEGKAILRNSKEAARKEKKANGQKLAKPELPDESKLNNTIYRDVKVLSGIYRYRKGNTPRTLKDCKYLFVTTNSALALASRKFEKSEYGNMHSLPTCLTDIFLGTLIWLHSPSELININEKKLLADCYSSMAPSDELITKYLEDVKKLRKDNTITSDHYYLLRTHKTAINLLESKTFGDPKEFTSQTIQEILEELIDEIKRDVTEQLNTEVDEHDLTKEKLRSEREKHKIMKGTIEALKEIEETRIKNINRNIEKKATKQANVYVKIIITLLTIIIVLSFVVQGLNQFMDIQQWLVTVVWIILAIAGLFNLLIKFNIISLRVKLTRRLTYLFKSKEKRKYKSYL